VLLPRPVTENTMLSRKSRLTYAVLSGGGWFQKAFFSGLLHRIFLYYFDTSIEASFLDTIRISPSPPFFFFPTCPISSWAAGFGRGGGGGVERGGQHRCVCWQRKCRGEPSTIETRRKSRDPLINQTCDPFGPWTGPWARRPMDPTPIWACSVEWDPKLIHRLTWYYRFDLSDFGCGYFCCRMRPWEKKSCTSVYNYQKLLDMWSHGVTIEIALNIVMIKPIYDMLWELSALSERRSKIESMYDTVKA